MNIRQIVLKHLEETVKERSPVPFPNPVPEEMLMEDFWLDSIAITTLLTEIENEVGFVPREILAGVDFPETVGAFIALYEKEAQGNN